MYRIYTSTGYLFHVTDSLWLACNFVKRCPNLKFTIQGDTRINALNSKNNTNLKMVGV